MGVRVGGLFTRLLLAQTLLAFVVSFVSISFYYFERNKTVAYILADQWAAPLTAALSRPGESAHPGIFAEQATLPTAAIEAVSWWPHVSALKRALGDKGIDVRRVAFEAREGDPVVWLELVSPQAQAARWLGVRGALFELRNLYFLALTIVVAVSLILALSWSTARYLTLPLERLRNRIHQGRPESLEERHSKRAPEVAEIGQAYDALLAQVDQQAKDRSLMLVGISHDLRTPLGRIRLAADLLPQAHVPPSLRQTIIRNVQVAEALIESFMDVVRAGDLPVDEAVDVSEQARLVAAEFQVDAGALTVVTPAQAIQQGSNAYLLRRLMHNLLENAFKHGHPPVTLTVQDRAEQGIWIEVVDAGDGIAADQREAVLRAFARGDGSRSTPGSGLGLTVVQQVLKRVGGTLSFEGRPGRWLVRVKLSGAAPWPATAIGPGESF